MRAERLEQAQASFEKQQERMAHLQKFIDRFKAKASKAKQAQSRVKALARMEKLAPGADQRRLPVRVPRAAEPAQPDARLRRRGLRLSGRRRGGRAAHRRPHRPLGARRPAHRHPRRQRPGQVDAGQDDRRRPAAAGRRDHRRQGPDDRLLRAAGARRALARRRPADAHGAAGARRRPGRRASRSCATSSARSASPARWCTQPVGTLSGGEKARLVLAMLVWQRPNLLLLDEPTNHLDLTTREALSMALNEFEGTVMLVSHDRALLREVCDEFWLVAARRARSPSTATSTTTRSGCSSSRARRRARPAAARGAGASGDVAGARAGRRRRPRSRRPRRRRVATIARRRSKHAPGRPIRRDPQRAELQRIEAAAWRGWPRTKTADGSQARRARCWAGEFAEPVASSAHVNAETHGARGTLARPPGRTRR